ncbi:hypothetical protein [Lentibacillus sediminis]|uniref:hypothetical protein n=1 Tax=Lentibacillus sediminis TaxID=1940529 RepID=UPI000C1C686A|nr:hypothetical protein [Lentibacillus sediminis]
MQNLKLPCPLPPITYFFQTALQQFSDSNNKLIKRSINLLIHLLYFALVSILICILLSFIMYILQSHSNIEAGLYWSAFWLIYGFTLFLFLIIYSLNFSSENLNLPSVFLDFYFIFKEINLRSHFIKTVIWFSVVIMVSFFFLNKIFTELFPNNQLAFTYSFVAYLFIVIFLFSEGTIDNNVKKATRKLVLWILLFVFLLGSSILDFGLQTNISENAETNIVMLFAFIVSLIFNFTQVIDNARNLYTSYLNDRGFITRKKNWINQHENYSYSYVKKLVNYWFDKILQLIDAYKSYSKAQKDSINKLIFIILIGAFSIALFSEFFKDIISPKVEQLIITSLNKTFNLLANYIGSEQNTVLIILIIPLFFFFYKNCLILIRKRKNYTYKEIFSRINICVMLCTGILLLISLLLDLGDNVIVTSLTFLLLLISFIIFPLITRVLTKIETLKNQ